RSGDQRGGPPRHSCRPRQRPASSEARRPVWTASLCDRQYPRTFHQGGGRGVDWPAVARTGGTADSRRAAHRSDVQSLASLPRFHRQAQGTARMTQELTPRILRARMQLMLVHPYLAAALARLPVVNAAGLEWCDTMATDGYYIYVNPSFCVMLPED